MFDGTDEVRVTRGNHQNEVPLHDDFAVLSPDDSKSIFEKLIWPDYKDGIVPRDNPRVVYVLGQPGAGKSVNEHLVPYGDGVTRVCGDDLKIVYPGYPQRLLIDPRGTGERIRSDYQAWQRQLVIRVRALRGDLVIETSPGPDCGFLDDVADSLAAGYRVELVVLAVRDADSRQGIGLRYARTRRLNGGCARFTSVVGHDACFAALEQVVEAIEKASLAHSVRVVRRDGTLLHHGERDAGGSLPGKALAALRGERARSYTREEAELFFVNQRELHRELPEHGAEWNDIAALAGPLLPVSLN